MLGSFIGIVKDYFGFFHMFYNEGMASFSVSGLVSKVLGCPTENPGFNSRGVQSFPENLNLVIWAACLCRH